MWIQQVCRRASGAKSLGLFLCGALLVAGEGRAAAYSYETALSVGCHERISTIALRTVRAQVATAPTISPDTNDLALIRDVPFGLDPDMKDLAAVTLLIGVRDNDLKGQGPTEIDSLAEIHGDPANQREHCLRAIDEDEPNGSARAVDACRGFIRERLVEALDGLDRNGVPDPNRRTDLDVALELRGGVTASLPLFWVRMGQAIHTMQDSFSHTFRSADRMRVRSVLNWIEYVNSSELESRDGPQHRSGLDACEDLDDLRNLNFGAATQASIELLHATLDPTLTRDAKLTAIDATLTKYLTYEPGCTDANGWCDAPEREYPVSRSCACSVIGDRSGGSIAAAACAIGFGFLVARRRRRLAKLVALPLALACLTIPSLARAQSTVTEQPPPTPGVPTPREAKAEQTEAEHRRFFGLYAAASGSVTNPAVNGQLGIRFRLSERWSVGLDGEINGWYAVQTKRLRTGAFNAYATVIFHYPIRFAQVNVRSTFNAGTSTMMIDLYGAPRGSTGLFLGLTPLGLELKLSPAVYLVFDALGVALPIPQLQGAPFAYPQYRSSLGVELTF